MRIITTNNYNDCIKYTCKEIESIYRQLDNRIFIFAEDKITLNLELELSKTLKGGCFGIEVLTLSRYINENYFEKKVLSKESSVIVIKKLLLMNYNNLKCFNNIKNSISLPLTIFDIISQLKSAKILVSDLEKVLVEKANINNSLLLKLNDIYFIYKEYEKYLEDFNLLDSSNFLSLMPDLLNNDIKIKNSTVFLCGFSTTTKQRLEIIKKINEISKNMLAIIVADEKFNNIYTLEFLKALQLIDNNCEILKRNENNILEIEALKKYLFNPLVFDDKFKPINTKQIVINQYSNYYEEIENIAKSICFNIINKEARFKDIALVIGDLSNYKLIINQVFQDYNIPFYIDNPIILGSHPLVNSISYLLEICKGRFNKNDIISFFNSSLIIYDNDLRNSFIEYLLQCNITKKSLNKEFTVEHKSIKLFNEFRNKLCNVISKFTSSYCILNYNDAINLFIEEFKIKENIKLMSKDLANLNEKNLQEFNDNALDLILNILNEISKIIDNSKLSLSEFKNLFYSGVMTVEVNTIPLFNDCVYIGEFKDIKLKSYKYLYAVGLNGDIPFSKSDTSILTDNDLNKLDDLKINIDPKIKEINRREKENVCCALLSFSNRLYVSYSSVGSNGKQLIKSELIENISKIFNLEILNSKKLQIESKSIKYKNSYLGLIFLTDETIIKNLVLLFNSYKDKKIVENTYSSLIEALKECGKYDLIKKINNILNNTEKGKTISNGYDLCIKDDFISSSVLEKYFSCPYSNYAQNILKLKPNVSGDLQVTDFGNILHLIVEKFINIINEINIDNLEKKVLMIFNEIIILDDYKYYVENEKYQAIFILLKREAKRICFNLFKSLEKSKFKPYKTEVKFGFIDSEFKEIELNSRKKRLYVRGKIDRIDLYNDYFRIIDYKTGSVKDDDSLFYTGNKLQLYLYMNAIKNKGYKPAGAYYYSINDKFVEDEGTTNLDTVGKTIGDLEIKQAMDSSITETTKKDLSEEEMKNYLEYAIKISETGANEIMEGFIEPTPYVDKCAYCYYSGMCGYSEKENNKTRTNSKVNKNDFCNIISKSIGENKND